MKSFEYVNAVSVNSSLKLADNAKARFLGGGTDLLPELKLRIADTNRLINLKTIPGLDKIEFDSTSGLEIGALATLSSIAANKNVQEHYPALFKAISLAASPQLRNRGTLGGNLNQDSRCWYYRGNFHCWLKGGDTCFAKDGNNYHHALFGGGPCYTVHPSDPPVALVALEAEVHLADSSGERTLPLEQFFTLPQNSSRNLTILKPSEIITGITIPPSNPDSQGTYLKAMDRQTWAFALAGIAVQLTVENNRVKICRVVLGGVAPTPWRLPAVEDFLTGRMLDDVTIDQASAIAVDGARPLSRNSYKIPLIKGLLIESLRALNR